MSVRVKPSNLDKFIKKVEREKHITPIVNLINEKVEEIKKDHTDIVVSQILDAWRKQQI